jgi:outer membrane receptor for monomeric catechols
MFRRRIHNPGNVIPDVFSVDRLRSTGPERKIAGRGAISGAVNIIAKQPDLNSVSDTPPPSALTTCSAQQSIPTEDLAVSVRANLMYDNHDIAGRDVTDSERWGGLFSLTTSPQTL